MVGDRQRPVPYGGEKIGKGSASFETVGRAFSRARKEKGKSLGDVAHVLCIRPNYLEALEGGDFANLPEDVYACGFARAYAEFLELDVAEIIRRFKQEVKNCSNKPELQFPRPASEGKMPGFAVFFVASFLFVLAYVGWLMLSSEDGRFDPVDLVPGISLKRFVPGPKEGEGAPEAVIADSASEVASRAEKEAEAPTSDYTTLAKEPDSVALVEEDSLGKVTTIKAEGVPSRENQLPETQATDPLEEGQRPVLHPGEPHEILGAERSQTSHPGAFKKEVFGAKDGQGSGISFAAVLDTWIQIESKEGRLLFARVLRAGDRYNVFGGEGQVMKTGNAGGIRVFINGREQPIIGDVGKVVSDIPLDASALEAFLAAR